MLKYSKLLKTEFTMNGQTSSASRTLIGNQIVDHSDVVGASPVILDLTPILLRRHLYIESGPRALIQYKDVVLPV